MTTVSTPPRVAARTAAPRPRRRVPVWLAVVAASLPMFMATLDNLVMTSALPVIRADLGSSVNQLSWFMNAYTLAFATFMLPAATLGDRLGRRRVMIAGVTVFTLASIASALSTTLGGADRRPGGPGPRRRGDHAALADPARRRRAREDAGRRHRHLGRRLRPRRRARPGRRRRGRRGRQLAGDLLAQRAGRAGRAAAAAGRGPRVPGAWQRLDLVGTRCSVARSSSASGASCTATTTAGARPACWSRWSLAALLVPAYVAWARGRSYAVLPLRLFSSRGFSVANVDQPDLHDRHVRHGLPARAVPPDRAGLQPARGRRPDPAVDRGADGGRPDRRRPGRPDRRAGPAPRRAGRCRPRRWSGSRG